MKAAAISCVATMVVASPSPDVLRKFQEFRGKWGHKYVGTEFTRRLGYFEKQLAVIDRLQRLEQGTAIYSHLGPFADSSPDEMAQRLGLFQTGILEQAVSAPILNKTVPHTLDWVEKGCVNPIQNQAQCGSCWSFSTAANLEGTGCVTNGGRLVKVSEQNIMDCDKTCYSCSGCWPSTAMAWVAHNGVASEVAYPYRGHNEACQSAVPILRSTGWIAIGKSSNHMKQGLVNYGPLSICVDATPFQTYTGGIMQNPSCSETRLDHAVNLVGYGLEGRLKYWKIRNSWATSWGEAGYIRVAGECTCGLCTTVVTATGVTISGSSADRVVV